MANEKWRIRTGSRRLEIDGVEVAGVTAAKLNAIPSAAESGFVTGVTAGTAAASKALVTNSAIGIGGGWRDTRVTPVFVQAAPAAKTTAVTLTAAELLGGLLTGTHSAGATAAYTLPLASDLETALIASHPGLANDDAFEFSLINLSAAATDTITVTTNTGWTLVGQMVVDDNNAATTRSAAVFRARRTAANTYTLYRIS